jgi:hypothetical protein
LLLGRAGIERPTLDARRPTTGTWLFVGLTSQAGTNA